MKKINLYEDVVLLRDLKYGIDFIGGEKKDILKGSIGLVIEEIDDETCLVEFSSEEYRDPVTSVKYVDLAIKK